MPNKVSKQTKEVAGSTIQSAYQEIQSPTSFLSGKRGAPLDNFCINDEKNSQQIEGEIIRKATETKLKKYWYCLLGKELYVYKNKTEEKHKGMHNLIGVFLKDEPEEQVDANTKLYPFKLIFPPNKTRTYYLQTLEEKEKWVKAIKKVIGYQNLFDFYDV